MIEAFVQDLRYGLRTLGQVPTFTLIAIGTLALGIGAAVAIFTVVNGILLRPVPIPQPDRVAAINAQYLKTNGSARGAGSWTKYEMLRDQETAFSGVAAYSDRDLTVDTGAGPIRVPGTRVTANLLDVLEVLPARGRNFAKDDDVEGAGAVTIVTDAFWQARLNADPNVIGKTIRVEGIDTPVIGVMPAGFRFHFSDNEPQVYLTRVFTPDVMTAVQIRTGAGFLSYIGRLKPGATFEQARVDLAAIDTRYGREHVGFVDSTVYGLRVDPFVEDLVGSVRPVLNVLMGAVLFLLMIACANVAHLLLSRAAVRQREVAVRLALGASRARLFRQFLTEALLLATGGCALGIVAARVAVTMLVSNGPEGIPRLADVVPDATVLAFAVVLGGLTAVIFGVVPVLRLRTVTVGESLKAGRPSSISNRFASRLQQLIAVSEAAVTVVLLISSVLLFRSLLRLQAVDPGFTTHNITTAQITLQQDKYGMESKREAFFTELLHGMQAVPGIAAVGATSYLPMAGPDYGFFFFIDGQPHLGIGRDPIIRARHISPDFFRVMQIPVRRGRAFNEMDASQSQPVVIINEATVKTYFPDKDPVGWHLANSRDGIMREIVGVVGNEHFSGPSHAYTPELYLPYRQVPPPSMTLVVSSTLPILAVASAIRSTVGRLDRDQAVAEIRTMERVVASTTTQQRFTSSMLGTFAAVATALAAIGLYGVVALFVSQRRHEFGIRMALGAQRRDVVRMVLRHGTILVGVGTFTGLVVAIAVSRLLKGLLFGITATEPLSYVIGALLLILMGLLACYIPARRALSVDPAQTLRAD